MRSVVMVVVNVWPIVDVVVTVVRGIVQVPVATSNVESVRVGTVVITGPFEKSRAVVPLRTTWPFSTSTTVRARSGLNGLDRLC